MDAGAMAAARRWNDALIHKQEEAGVAVTKGRRFFPRKADSKTVNVCLDLTCLVD